MRKIFYAANLIAPSEIEENSYLIKSILNGELKYPQNKKLKAVSYLGAQVFRAKIDDKNRLIYSYQIVNGERVLCVLAVNNHNYDKLKRQLSAKNNTHLSESQLFDEPEPLVNPSNSSKLQCLPVVSNKQSLLALDEKQRAAHKKDRGALLFKGPPGSGKSSVLYNSMSANLHAFNIDSLDFPFLFLSKSKALIDDVKADHAATSLLSPNIKIHFLTLSALLASHYPGFTEMKENDFAQWLAKTKCTESARIVHYELSLIAALGAEKYISLGNRQCYYAKSSIEKNTPDKSQIQSQLISLLADWQAYLKENKAFDPMVSGLDPAKGTKYRAIFCDEAQNLPPVIFFSLILRAQNQRFTAALDSEQCLLSSPYIESCLKILLYGHYENYEEIMLDKTWRCPPSIIQAANRLMNFKYERDETGNRRSYSNLESTLPESSGFITRIDAQGLTQLKSLGERASTVVIVDKLDEALRKEIYLKLGTHNILTPEEAIGLEFDDVILWKPVGHRKALQSLANLKKGTNNLSLEQLNKLNAMYVSLTRSKKAVYVYEEEERWDSLLTKMLGELPKNQFKVELIAQDSLAEKRKWEDLADKYLKDDKIDNAVLILKTNLGFTDKEIALKVKDYLPKNEVKIELQKPDEPQLLKPKQAKPKKKMGAKERQLAIKKKAKEKALKAKEDSDINSNKAGLIEPVKPKPGLSFEKMNIISSYNAETHLVLRSSDVFDHWFAAFPLKQAMRLGFYHFYKIDDNTLAINQGPHTPGIQFTRKGAFFDARNNWTADNYNKYCKGGACTLAEFEEIKKEHLFNMLTWLNEILPELIDNKKVMQPVTALVESKKKIEINMPQQQLAKEDLVKNRNNTVLVEPVTLKPILIFDKVNIISSYNSETHLILKSSDVFEHWFAAFPLKKAIRFLPYHFYKVDDNTLSINKGPNTLGIQFIKKDNLFKACNNLTADNYNRYCKSRTCTLAEFDVIKKEHLFNVLTWLNEVLPELIDNNKVVQPATVELQKEIKTPQQQNNSLPSMPQKTLDIKKEALGVTGKSLSNKEVISVASTSKQYLQLFKPSIDIRKFLHYLVRGNHEAVKTMLTGDVSLFYRKGEVTDCSGRTFKNISGFEYALWALDKHMWVTILECLPINEQGIKVLNLLKLQYNNVSTKGVTYQLNDNIVTENHFDLNILISALQKQVDLITAPIKNSPQISDQWVKEVGVEQQRLPMNIVYEYCNTYFSPEQRFVNRPKCSQQFHFDGKKEWFSPDSFIGERFAMFKWKGEKTPICVWSRACVAKAHETDDINALTTLHQVRREDFLNLKLQLEKQKVQEHNQTFQF